jgi:hypothetical protein
MSKGNMPSMPPTAIQHRIDPRWEFEAFSDLREMYWSGQIMFMVDRTGTLVEEYPEGMIPPAYLFGSSHYLERAIYFGIPLVHVEFI